MPRAITWTVFNILILSVFLTAATCQKKVDAYQCFLINVDSNGNYIPMEKWYWFCRNHKTKEEKTVWLKNSTRCIRDNTRACKWLGTDQFEFELWKKAAEEEQGQ